MTESPVLYDEVDRLGIITLNRPQKLNALTNEMVQAVADSVAAATASPNVGAIVLRGSNGTLTAGYDLSALKEYSGPTEPASWDQPFDGGGTEPRPGNWDPGARLPVHEQTMCVDSCRCGNVPSRSSPRWQAGRWAERPTWSCAPTCCSWPTTPTSAMRPVACSACPRQ